MLNRVRAAAAAPLFVDTLQGHYNGFAEKCTLQEWRRASYEETIALRERSRVATGNDQAAPRCTRRCGANIWQPCCSRAGAVAGVGRVVFCLKGLLKGLRQVSASSPTNHWAPGCFK